MKLKTRKFRIKGSYYYSAQLALDKGLLHTKMPLQLLAEPDNRQDPYAQQLWLTQFPCLLLGYVPKRKSRFIDFLQRNQLISSVLLHSTQTNHDKLRLYCQLDYLFSWKLQLKYWWQYLVPSMLE